MLTNHRLALNIAIGLVWLTGVFSSKPADAAPPNIVVLFSDDAGYADFGFQPNCRPEMRELTPHIDSIARDGLRLSNAYMAGCVCSPSRAGLMTGRYQQRFGFDNNLPPGTPSGLDLQEKFGTKRLQELGYRTGLIGKWHLGYPEAYHPNQRGFDDFYGLLQGSRSYHPIKNPSPHRVILSNRTRTPEVGYVTDRFGDAACEFISKHKQQPFYLFVSFTAPHGPLQPKDSVKNRIAHIPNRARRNFAGLVVTLDDNVGKILRCLKEHNLDETTLVIFTNDNGGQTQVGADNTPLRGRKGMLYEGGIRVPWAMRWTGTISPGQVLDDPVISLDLLPTLIELAGGQPKSSWKLDGRSFANRLTAARKQPLPARPLFWRTHGPAGPRAVREGNWKLVELRTGDGGPELFDLSRDLGEQHDLSAMHPEIVKRLQAKLNAWESQLSDPRWGPGAVGPFAPKTRRKTKTTRKN